MSLKTILEKVFPFLFSEVTKAWDSLPSDQQSALINSGQIGQILKEELSNGAAAVLNAIEQKTGIPEATAEQSLLALAGHLGYSVTTVTDFIDQLQAKINAGLSDPDWDALWAGITGTAIAIFSDNIPAAITAGVGLLGALGKLIYDKFIKKNVPITQDAQNAAADEAIVNEAANAPVAADTDGIPADGSSSMPTAAGDANVIAN